jgi:methionine biosynthesis protein MetW
MIIPLISAGASVIDLACGNGSLLSQLIQEKKITGKGIDIAESGVQACRSKGLDVMQGRIDEPLPFADSSFDYAICNVTIQMVMYPEVLLSEMKRVAKYQIITFPNFGFIKNRIDHCLNGRMPKHMLFGYKWYSTGHIHQLSIRDFYELVADVGGLKILRHISNETNNPLKKFLRQIAPNMFQILPLFFLTSEETKS